MSHSSLGTNKWDVTLQTVGAMANAQTEKQIIICIVCMSYEVSIETKKKKKPCSFYTVYVEIFLIIDDLENTASTVNMGEQPRGHRGQKELGKARAHLCSPRRTKERKDPAFALNGSMTCAERKSRSEEETDGPILYEKAEREDVTWESPQNKPSVRCKACVAADIAR